MIKINVIGIESLQKRIAKASNDVKVLVDAELQASAMDFVALAKRDLATQGGDRGTLLRSIAYTKESNMAYKVSANAVYAPFIEFGTKSKFNPYPGTEQFAAQFRGTKQGGAIKLIDAIKGWVKRKGIAKGKEADRAAFLIARSIFRNGISPKPFFYKQIIPVRTKLLQNLNRVLDAI